MTHNNANSGFSISRVAIKQHIGTLMLTLAVIVLGVLFSSNLQTELLPSITYPRIGIRLEAPGISPEVAIDEITKPLEETMSATEGVVQVYSQTREGQVSLDLYFEPGENIDVALNDATAIFNRGRSRLPDNLDNIRIFKFEPSQLPVYEIAFSSQTIDPLQLRIFAEEELARELNYVRGVASTDVAGGLEEEVRISIDLKRLQAVGVGLSDVLDELSETNQDISSGRIIGENRETLTRAKGKFQTVEEINNLSFNVDNNRVYLRDFASVIDGSEKQRIFVYLNKQPAVKISIQKQPEANTIEVIDGVKKRIGELREQGLITEEMELIPTLDESILIRDAISNVTSSGLFGALLAAIAVLLFLGSVRQTIIIVLAIPLATLGAIILMGFFGLSLNVFSLGGLALGVGIVVDNSIVMLENIAEGAGMTPGKDSKASLSQSELIKQAIRSSQEVESALVASTSTNLVAVLPFLLIGGFISLLFNELILTISFAVAASILVAVTVVPMLASRLLGITWSTNVSKSWLLRQFNRRFEAATRGYAVSLAQVLKQPLIIIIITFLLLGGSSLLMLNQIPREIVKRINTQDAILSLFFPPGIPLATNHKIMDAIDNILLNQPETEYVFTTIGGTLFGSNTNENPLRSSSNITLKPGTDVDSFITRVNQELEKLNLVDIRLGLRRRQVRGLILSNSPVGQEDLDIIIQGENQQELTKAGFAVLDALKQATQATFRPDVDRAQPEIQIIPDLERLSSLGLNIQDIGDTLTTAIDGTVPSELERGNRLVPIRVELDESFIRQPSDLNSLPLFTENNQLIRLADVARIEAATTPGEIKRLNQRTVFIIAGSLNEGASLGTALAEIDQIFQQIQLPKGVSRLQSAAAQSNQQIQGILPVLGGLAIFLVFVVMAVQYNSLIDPLVILFTIPLALAGGIWGLFLTQTAISATVVVGAVLLVGIVVNNAIIMIELANQIRERENISRYQAILLAAPQRLRPVLMTTITTVVGMFPIALGLGQGGEFLQPLGVVVFSGLSLATLLTLFIIPCFYILLHEWINLMLKLTSIKV